MNDVRYGFGKTVALGFEAAIEKVTQALAQEGFGILTEIDVQATLKKKLGHDMPPYRILGACNPRYAHQALSADLEVGAMLPCNVVVYEGDDGKAVVMAIDPMQTMAAARPALRPIAERVREGLARVVARVE
jgi:uncharacterized protein (DUF302 family)